MMEKPNNQLSSFETKILNEQVLSVNDSILTVDNKPSDLGVRHMHAILIFLGLAVLFGCRMVLPVSIVAMTSNITNSDFEQLNWTEETQGIIFSSFYWGLMPSTIIGATVVQRVGGKWPYFVCIFGISFLTMLTPLIAINGWIFMCMKQVMEGILMGLCFSSVLNLLGKWIHPLERDSIVPVVLSGPGPGVILSMSTNGFIAASRFGWPGTFYLPGIFGIVWSIIWLKYGRKSPDECETLSKEESLFLATASGTLRNNLKTPWKQILSSKPVWAQILSLTGFNWGFTLLVVIMPTYIKHVLGVDIESNGLLSTIPQAANFFISIGVGSCSNYLTKNKICSTLSARKLFNSLGMCIPAISLIILSFVSNNIFMVMILFSIAFGFNGAINASVYISPLDVAPNYASIINGLYHFVGTFSAILSPLSFGYIVQDPQDLTLWRIVFFIAAGFFMLGDLIYRIYNEVEIQEWNYNDINDTVTPFEKKDVELKTMVSNSIKT